MNANTTQSENDNIQITEGTPATYQIGSDFYPYTITRVSPSGKTVWARKDRVVGKGLFVPGTGAEEKFTLRQFGQFKPVGSRCGILRPGKRSFDLDPGF